MKERKWFSKADCLVLCLLGLFAAAFFLWRAGASPGTAAVVTVEGETVLTVDLAACEARETYTLPNGVELLAEAHTIRVAFSDCPDGLCMQAGVLSKAGDTAVCVPNRTVVSVVGSDRPVHAVTY